MAKAAGGSGRNGGGASKRIAAMSYEEFKAERTRVLEGIHVSKTISPKSALARAVSERSSSLSTEGRKQYEQSYERAIRAGGRIGGELTQFVNNAYGGKTSRRKR